MKSSMKKIALDDAAKKYWKMLYGEYGEALVRDIPRRIKAALEKNTKSASASEVFSVLPIAHVVDGEHLCMEGLYKSGSTVVMFNAKLDKECNVVDVKSFNIG